MILVALTGGIGAGKSTVSAALAERGAVIVDADLIVRDVQAPGEPVLDAIAARFGPEVVQPDGQLDRAAVAAKVFGDPAALADLNAIVHPAVGREMSRRIEEQRATDHVVVLDIPLLAEGDSARRYAVAGVIVVDAPEDIAIERLVAGRGMPEADARVRIARQASRQQRVAVADQVIDNSGDREALAAQIDRVWAWIEGLPPSPAEAPPPPVAES